MARSPTGTFTLVAGNPVITGTIITSDWANTTMPDIGAALTDSLSRTGQGGMLAPFRGVSGSVTSPAHSFTDFPRSGMYAVSANEMRYAVNGVDRMRWQAGGLPTQTYNVATGLWEDLEPVGVVGPNLLDNSSFQVHQRGNIGTQGLTFIDRWRTFPPRAGETTEIAVGTIDTTSLRKQIRATVSGQTGYWDIAQRFRTDRLTNGKTYTFSFETGVMDSDIIVSVKLQGRDVSGGVWDYFTPDITDITLTSNTVYSFTFDAINITAPLNTADDFFQVVLSTEGANNGSDFILPDGSYHWYWFKLEEGNVFTGYEPTPYAIDEAECMKWYQVPFDTTSISPFYANIYRSAGSAGAQDHVINVQIRPKMYFSPVVVDESYVGAVAPDSVQTNRNSMRVLWINTVSPTSEVGVDNLALSCEL